MTNILLQTCDLSVSIDNTQILKGINLAVNSGEIHAIMGPNGSGKSTLGKIIAGHPAYQVIGGSIKLRGQDITYESPDVRSHKGIFLGFQYPVEISGVLNIDFLRLSYNSLRRANDLPEIDPLSFLNIIDNKLSVAQIESKFLTRNVNEGFSGGEKKKNEILQMATLEPRIAILDEIDSGLDIDALKSVAQGIKALANNTNGIILITHYQRLLDYIKPNFVHVMWDGQIKHTGNSLLAKQLEETGYTFLK